jgi:hypothetical protein
MNGPSNSAYSSKGSGGIPLTSIEEVMAIAESYEDILHDVMEEIRDEQQQHLREVASHRPAWEALSESMSVSFSDDGGFDYLVEDDGSFVKREYGDLSTAPSPLLRPFILRQAKSFPQAFEDKLKGRL